MSAAMGWQAQMAIGAAGTEIGAFATAIEFVSEEMRKRGRILQTSGLRGGRGHPSERTAEGICEVGGTIRLHVSPALLDLVWPLILGGTKGGDNTIALTETLPEFDLLIDRVTRRFVYRNCRVNQAVLRGQSGGLVELVLSLIGKSEEVSSMAFPAISAALEPPYLFQQGVLTLQSAARSCFDFELTIDHRLQRRYANSATATELLATDRVVSFRCSTPFTAAEVGLYQQSLSGAAGTLALTNGTRSCQLQFGCLQFPDLSPVVAGREEIPLKLDGIARRVGSTAELIVTNDSTV